jgi:hypothetical protein
VFTVLYYVVFTPAGLLRRTFGRSPLKRSSAAAETFFVDRERDTPEQQRRALEHLY